MRELASGLPQGTTLEVSRKGARTDARATRPTNFSAYKVGMVMDGFRAWFLSRPVRASVVLFAATAAVLYAASALVALTAWRAFDASVVAAAGSSAGQGRQSGWEFRFAESTVTVDVSVDAGVLAASERIRTRRVFRSSGWLRQRYISTLVRRQSSDPFITRLAEELDREAVALGIADDDTRLEFYAAAVQAIPYGEVDSEIRLPIEVVARGSGVCTEKSLLLAELLLCRGYSTVLWVLPTQRHVALGVATTGEGYRDSGFAFLETTRPAWIGEVDQTYRAAGPIARKPVVIALGGTTRYESGAQVEYVLRVLDATRREANAYGRYGANPKAAPGVHGHEYAALARRSDYAQRTAEWIEASPHQRAEVFGRLTAEGRDR